VESNSFNESDNFESAPQAQKINQKSLKNAFTEYFAPILYYEHFKMHQSIKNKKFENSLKIGKSLLRRFLHATYNSYYSVNYSITRADINRFIESISKVEGFPFSDKELTDFLATCENVSFEPESVEKRSREIFEQYSTIFDKFKRYIEGDTEAI
jgi:hypothetical protein